MLFAVTIDRTAFDVFHHEVRDAVGCFASIEESSDVGMVQIGEDLHLVAKAPANCFAAETWIDEFDRNLLAVVFIVAFREKHCAHATVAQLTHNSECANPRSDSRGPLIMGVHSKASSVRCALFHCVVASVNLLRQQQINFSAQLCVVCACFVQKHALSAGVELERFGEYAFHLLPTIRSDFCLPPAAELAPQPQLC